MGKRTVEIGSYGDRFDVDVYDTIRFVLPKPNDIPGERVWTVVVTDQGGLEISLSDRGGPMETILVQPEAGNAIRLGGTRLGHKL